jgi:hypothetical protein
MPSPGAGWVAALASVPSPHAVLSRRTHVRWCIYPNERWYQLKDPGPRLQRLRTRLVHADVVDPACWHGLPGELVQHGHTEIVGEYGIRHQRLGQDGGDVAPATIFGDDGSHETLRRRIPGWRWPAAPP